MMELREHVAGKYYESAFIVVVVNIRQDTKPVRIRRTYEGKTYEFWCYITLDVKQKLLAGQIVVGDKVVVLFVEAKGDKPLIIGKVVGV